MIKLVIDSKTIHLNHADRILFPETKITKKDVLEYYLSIADYQLFYIKNRPVTIRCFLNGINEEGFYRQHAPRYAPDWLQTIELKRKMGGYVNHILCQNKASLAYLATQNMIEIHRWLSTVKLPEIPDIMLIDIDPPLERFDLACKAARLLKDRVQQEGYHPYVMTTGSRGLHIVIPIKEPISFEKSREILKKICFSLAMEYSSEFSIDVRKRMRKNLVYLDVYRNAYGQSGIAPYSVRARSKAPVATPLRWEEIEDPRLRSDSYNIHNIKERLESLKGDPWSGYPDSST